MSYLPFFIIRVLLFDNFIVPARRHKDSPSAVNAEFSFVNRLSPADVEPSKSVPRGFAFTWCLHGDACPGRSRSNK